MKCSKCGAELTEDTKFCSYCGKKIEGEMSTSIDEIGSSEPVWEETTNQTNFLPKTEKKSSNNKMNGNTIANKIKDKCISLWNKLSLYEKITAVALVIFVLMCFVAFLTGKILAGIIAIVSIILTVISLLMKKQIIKISKSWLHIVALLLAVFLIVPYIWSFKIDYGDAKYFKWSDIILGDVVPKPHNQFGEIINNSESYLSVYIYKTNKTKFDAYVSSCKEKGFTIDAEESERSFCAYDSSGYELSLYFDESDNKMSISVNVPEKYEKIEWSNSDMAKLIPIPKSNVGKIERDDATGFSVYVGETSIEDYREYVKLCSDKGFTFDESKSEKTFSAKNSEGYKLIVEYINNNRIHITIEEPEYQINLKIKCVENLIFSKYDVEVYVDDSYKGTIEHGTEEAFAIELKKGTHTIKFINEEDNSVDGKVKIDVSQDETFKFKISCTSSQIKVKKISEDDEKDDSVKSTESKTQVESDEDETDEVSDDENVKKENLTVDNCPELAAILANKAEIDDSYSAFASKYAGQAIEFDGRIDYCARHGDFKTRFDYLVSAGDYDPDHQIGPVFKFEDVAYYDLNTNLDTVSVGLNVHIIAEVKFFDSNSGLFFLEPISITRR